MQVDYVRVWRFVHAESPSFKNAFFPRSSSGKGARRRELSSHKKPAVRTAIRARGAHLLFLPLYSPDLNPIEQVLAKPKRLLRKANERTVEATWCRIGSLLDNFPPAECANYIRGAGYA